jgi:hypothetical protein
VLHTPTIPSSFIWSPSLIKLYPFLCLFLPLWPKYSSQHCVLRGAGIVQWYSAGLRAGWSGVRVSLGAGNFSLHHLVQTGSGAYPTSYPVGTRGSFPGGKAAGVWIWPLTSIYCRGKDDGSIPPPSQCAHFYCVLRHRQLCSSLSVRDQLSHP